MFSNAPVVAAGCALLRRFILRKRSGEFWIASAYLPGRHRLQLRHGMRRTGSFLSDKRRLHQPHPGGVSKLDARLHLYRCKISLCRPVRPEVNRIDLIRTSGGIRAVAQFEKKAACSTYAPLLRQGPTIMQLRGRIENSEEMS